RMADVSCNVGEINHAVRVQGGDDGASASVGRQAGRIETCSHRSAFNDLADGLPRDERPIGLSEHRVDLFTAVDIAGPRIGPFRGLFLQSLLKVTKWDGRKMMDPLRP